jgi:hypothetical protein
LILQTSPLCFPPVLLPPLPPLPHDSTTARCRCRAARGRPLLQRRSMRRPSSSPTTLAPPAGPPRARHATARSPPELTAGCHACRRCCQLLLERAAPLLALKHAQQLLRDLLYSRTHSSSTAFPFPERSSSPDLRRRHCSLSTTAAAVSQPQSNTPAAPWQPTGAPQPIQFPSPAPEHRLPQRRQAQSSATTRPHRQLTVTEPLSPRQGHQ